MPDIKLAKLDKNGGLPEIEIVIGQAQFGRYSFSLWDATGHNPVVVREGVNTDGIPDIFVIDKTVGIQTVDDLNGRFFSWSVNIAAFSNSPGQLYSVAIHIRQKGNDVPDAPFISQGPLTGAEVVADGVKFVTQ